MNWNRAISFLVCLIPCLLLAGCTNSVPLGKVTGTVTYNGQPLKHGFITLLPEKGPSANGKIIDGKITDIGVNKVNDGAPLGKCKITIVSFDNPDADMYTPKNSVIPERYGQAATSELSADIKSGVNELKLEVKD